MKIIIGVIGYRNHALRIIDLLSHKKNVSLARIYHPDKKLDIPAATNKLGDLYDCNAVVIASPNETHFGYISDLLGHFKGYIFCEKPPVCKMSHIEKLSVLPDADKGRVYFNYNFRFGILNGILNDHRRLKKLGDLRYISVSRSHGLAYKKGFAGSWRADGKHNLHSITETVAIHYLDLLMLHFGPVKNYFYSPSAEAGNGSAYDTALLSLEFDKIRASIFTSYACPHSDETLLLGENGILKIAEEKLRIYHPRDTFDSAGFFKNPPLIEKKAVSMTSEYANSLSLSLDFFLSHVRKGIKFDPRLFNNSLASNRFLLQICK